MGVAYRWRVWLTGDGCGLQMVGVAYRWWVWRTGGGCGVQVVGVAYRWQRSCKLQMCHESTLWLVTFARVSIDAMYCA